jgi:hypothetical protein
MAIRLAQEREDPRDDGKSNRSTLAFRHTQVLAIVLLTIAATLMTAHGESPIELGRFGPVPVPKGWNVIDRGRVEHKAADPPLEWIVFGKEGTKEYLSVAIFPAQRNRGGRAIFLGDTSVEVFPDGRFGYGTRTNSRSGSVNSLRSQVVDVQRYEALEYSFVYDVEDTTEDFLAHGYILMGDFNLVVQHTSDRPITPYFVADLAAEMMRRVKEISQPKMLKLFEDKPGGRK